MHRTPAVASGPAALLLAAWLAGCPDGRLPVVPDPDAGPGPTPTCSPVARFADGDGDGWGAAAIEACATAPGTADRGGDCDDGAPGIHPDAAERCNDADDNCDGTTDAGAIDAPTWYADADRDGAGDPRAPGRHDLVVASSEHPQGALEPNGHTGERQAGVHVFYGPLPAAGARLTTDDAGASLAGMRKGLGYEEFGVAAGGDLNVDGYEDRVFGRARGHRDAGRRDVRVDGRRRRGWCGRRRRGRGRRR